MLITRLRIDGQEFHLPPEADVPALQGRIVEAVTGRPAFVTFHPVGHGEISVLVTAQLPVRFETEEISDEEYDRWTSEPPSIDVFPQIP
jgi:hypothetical protein